MYVTGIKMITRVVRVINAIQVKLRQNRIDFKMKCVLMVILYSVFVILSWCVWGESTETMIYGLLKPAYHFVDTEGCIIPYANPFDRSIRTFYIQPKNIDCWTLRPFTSQTHLTLKLNKQAVSITETFSHCTYQEIIRDPKTDDSVSYSKSIYFKQDVNISVEFIRVKCFDYLGRELYTNYHAFTPPKRTIMAELDHKLADHRTKNTPKEILNVVMVGVDSLSRLNHVRNMPKTRDFLLHNLSATDFQGYTKVADNTFVNLVPMTTGNFVAEEGMRSNVPDSRGYFDKFNIIWKNFSSYGYVTSFSEDAPDMSIFNYLAKGFINPPVDHYLRPFSVAIDNDLSVWKKSRSCFWDRSETKLVLDYTYDFINTYQDRPHFDFTFISRITHGRVADAAYIDDDYFEFFTNLQNHGLLNNTVLFYFGDHGVRFGDFLKTEIGQLEVRMPMMYVVFPQWFREKYPAIIQNVINNSKKLTSPFDIYETLKDILDFTGKPRQHVDLSKRGISLFDKIPETRTCDDAAILPQWCVCKMDEINISRNDSIAKESIKYLIKEVNDKFLDYPVCAKLALKEVNYVKHFKNDNVRLKFGHTNIHNGGDGRHNSVNFTHNATDTANNRTDKIGVSLYRLYLTLKPGGGEFQAAVKYNETNQRFHLAGGISRNNLYGHTADCVNDSNIRKFCFCKNQTGLTSTSAAVLESYSNIVLVLVAMTAVISNTLWDAH